MVVVAVMFIEVIKMVVVLELVVAKNAVEYD